MRRGASGNKLLDSISTYDSEFKRFRMDTNSGVPLASKPAHTITEPPPNCRLEKKKCLFASHTNNGENHRVTFQITFFFHRKIRHLFIEKEKKRFS